MLKAGLQAEILRMHFSDELSRRQIAQNLGINRKSVGKVIDRRGVLISPQQQAVRMSILAPYYPQIEKMLEDAPARSCVNMLQQLRRMGYMGGITIVREYVRTVRPGSPAKAFFTLNFAMGEAAQVDWGEFGDVFGNGTRVHVFVMVLCWSRMLYLEFTLRETLPTLLRCYERALGFFGGNCREYWHDNMPTVVAERIGRLSRLTQGFLAYSGFHGFRPVLCNKGAGNEKGRVEDGVKLVRHQFWPGRTFTDIDDMNRQAFEWRDRFANRREHEATGKVPELMFEQERSVLLPLRADPYDTDDLLSCKVSSSFRVRFETNAYSVPWTLVGKPVTVRADDKQVRIFYGHKRIAQHDRCYGKNQDIKNPSHEEGLRQIKPGASQNWQHEAIASFGPHARRYLEMINGGSRSLRSELNELLLLSTVYGHEPLEQVIGELLQTGRVGVSYLERALRLREEQPKAPPPLQLTRHANLDFVPPVPNLAAYDSLLLDARTEQEDPE